jgi:NAD(P)-dependent dehydrogenase (short-subunit alcohol dehydrogenase family)
MVVETNVLGTMYGTKVAILGMLAQGFGALYNVEGLGSDGRIVDGLAVYGSTKSALRYLDRSLEKQLAGMPVIVGALSPGMLVTDMLMAQYKDRPPEEWERAKRVFNLLADRVENVAPWMAEQILKNEKSGALIKWLTPEAIAPLTYRR